MPLLAGEETFKTGSKNTLDGQRVVAFVSIDSACEALMSNHRPSRWLKGINLGPFLGAVLVPVKGVVSFRPEYLRHTLFQRGWPVEKSRNTFARWAPKIACPWPCWPGPRPLGPLPPSRPASESRRAPDHPARGGFPPSIAARPCAVHTVSLVVSAFSPTAYVHMYSTVHIHCMPAVRP